MMAGQRTLNSHIVQPKPKIPIENSIPNWIWVEGSTLYGIPKSTVTRLQYKSCFSKWRINALAPCEWMVLNWELVAIER
jgi:hypothetical protein